MKLWERKKRVGHPGSRPLSTSGISWVSVLY
mgnify:CR=1